MSTTSNIDVHQVLTSAQRSIDVRRVFGDPIEREGVTIIPVASVRGGGGGGGGNGPDESTGSGAGFGVTARPAGFIVVRGDHAEWKPTGDPDRIALAGLAVVALLLLVVRSVLGRR
jgi:uncharacterized spore protein YtfJ